MIRKIRYPNNKSFESKVTCIHHYESSIFIGFEDGRLLELKGEREYDYDRRIQDVFWQLLPDTIAKMAAVNNVLWCYTIGHKVERWSISDRMRIDARIPVGIEPKDRPSPSFFVPEDTLNYGTSEYIQDLVAWEGEILASHGDGLFNIWTSHDKFDCLKMGYHPKIGGFTVKHITNWNDLLCFSIGNIIFVMKKPWKLVFIINSIKETEPLAITSTKDHLFIVHGDRITKWDVRGNQIQFIRQLPISHNMLFGQEFKQEIGLIAWHGDVMLREKNIIRRIHRDVGIHDQLIVANGKHNTTIDGGICGIHTDLQSLVIWKIQPAWTPKLHSTFPRHIQCIIRLLMIMALKQECQLHVLPKDILLLVVQFSATNWIFKTDGVITFGKRKFTMKTAIIEIESEDSGEEGDSIEEPEKKRKKSST